MCVMACLCSMGAAQAHMPRQCVLYVRRLPPCAPDVGPHSPSVVPLLLTQNVTPVERLPDLGSKCGARADTFLTQPARYAKGKVQSGLMRNLGRKGISRERERERERDDCDSEQVKKTEMGISGLRGTSYIPKDD